MPAVGRLTSAAVEADAPLRREPRAAGLDTATSDASPRQSGAAPGEFILNMQRTLGNRAVQRWLQRSRGTATPAEAGEPNLAARLSAGAGGGQPLEPGTQSWLQQGLGADFSSVRVHADSAADRLARSVDALAFTSGSDLYFRAGAYDPGSRTGQRVLAHEAAHVVQQASGPVDGTAGSGGVAISEPGDAFERAAVATAAQLMSASSAEPPAPPDGNSASTPAVQRTQAAPAGAMVLQRCGGQVHAGCACAEDVPGALALQRHLDDETNGQVVQRFTDGTPDAPSAELPDGSPYAGMNADLLAMLGRTLTAKTLWIFTGKQPTNLGAALDLLGPADINTLVQLQARTEPVGLWRFITTISGLWSTSSLGVDFAGPGGIEAAVDGHANFCKDTAIGESYHHGQSCWREMVPSGTPGLHVCGETSIHIDPHQTVEGERGTGWSFGGDWGIQLTDVCKYSFLAWIGHMGDVEGGNDVNVFTRFDHLRTGRPEGKITQVRVRVQNLGSSHADFAGRTLPRLADLDTRLAALEPTLRQWAVAGLEGGDGTAAVPRVLGELAAVEKDLAGISTEVDNEESADVPVLWGP